MRKGNKMATQPSHRRKDRRGPDYGRRDQAWGSSRSGSPGSSAINGSPRSGRRRDNDTQTDHSHYVNFLNDLWKSVERKGTDKVTTYIDKDFNPGNQEVSSFDCEGFFAARQFAHRHPHQQYQQPYQHPLQQNYQGSPPYSQMKPNS